MLTLDLPTLSQSEEDGESALRVQLKWGGRHVL